MNCNYVLDASGNPVPEPDLMKWASWFESRTARIVKQQMIGESRVSTVFLGIDHSFGDGPPVLWETMVFGGPLSDEQDRCSGNREQAEAMHEQMVQRVRQSQPTP